MLDRIERLEANLIADREELESYRDAANEQIDRLNERIRTEQQIAEQCSLMWSKEVDCRLAEEKKVSLLLEAVIAIRAWLPAPSKYVKNSKLHEVIEKCDAAIEKAKS
jgi:hypothetical protein